MFIPGIKIIDSYSFVSGCHGSDKILGYSYFSLIKVMLHSDDSILFAVFYKSSVIHSNIDTKFKEVTHKRHVFRQCHWSPHYKLYKQVAFFEKLIIS